MQKVECDKCGNKFSTPEVRSCKCPLCKNEITLESTEFKPNKRNTKFNRADNRASLLLSVMKLFEHLEEFKHVTDDHLEQDWVVIPYEKLEKTLSILKERSLSLCFEMNLSEREVGVLSNILEKFFKEDLDVM